MGLSAYKAGVLLLGGFGALGSADLLGEVFRTRDREAVLVEIDAPHRRVKLERKFAEGDWRAVAVAHRKPGDGYLKISLPPNLPLSDLRLMGHDEDPLPFSFYRRPVERPGAARPIPRSAPDRDAEEAFPETDPIAPVTVGSRTFLVNWGRGLQAIEGESPTPGVHSLPLTRLPSVLDVDRGRLVLLSGSDDGGAFLHVFDFVRGALHRRVELDLEGSHLASFFQDDRYVIITKATRETPDPQTPWTTGLLIHRYSLGAEGIEAASAPEFVLAPGHSLSNARIVRAEDLTFVVSSRPEPDSRLRSTLHLLTIGDERTRLPLGFPLSGHLRFPEAIHLHEDGLFSVVSETWPPRYGEPEPAFIDAFQVPKSGETPGPLRLRTLSVPVFEPLQSVAWSNDDLFIGTGETGAPIRVDLSNPLASGWERFAAKPLEWETWGILGNRIVAIAPDENGRLMAGLYQAHSRQLLHRAPVFESGSASAGTVRLLPIDRHACWVELAGTDRPPRGLLLAVDGNSIRASPGISLDSPARAVWKTGSEVSILTASNLLSYSVEQAPTALRSLPLSTRSDRVELMGDTVLSTAAGADWENPSGRIEISAASAPWRSLSSVEVGDGLFTGFCIGRDSILFTTRYTQREVETDAGTDLTGFLTIEALDLSDPASPIRLGSREQPLRNLFREARFQGFEISPGRQVWISRPFADPEGPGSRLEVLVTELRGSGVRLLGHSELTLPPHEIAAAIHPGSDRLFMEIHRREKPESTGLAAWVRSLRLDASHRLRIGPASPLPGNLLGALDLGHETALLPVWKGRREGDGTQEIALTAYDGCATYHVPGSACQFPSVPAFHLRDGHIVAIVAAAGKLETRRWDGTSWTPARRTPLERPIDPRMVRLAGDRALAPAGLEGISVVDLPESPAYPPRTGPGPVPDKAGSAWRSIPLSREEIVSALGDDVVGSLGESRPWRAAGRPAAETDFATWMAARGLGDPMPETDDDGDGVSNLAEFALGTDPARYTSRPHWLLHPLTDGGLLFRFVPDPAARGLIVTPQSSADLRVWTDLVARRGVVVVPPGEASERPFFRLRIQLRPGLEPAEDSE